MAKNCLPLRAKWSLLPYGAEAFRLPPSSGKRKNHNLSVLCVSAVSTLLPGGAYLAEHVSYVIVFMNMRTKRGGNASWFFFG